MDVGLSRLPIDWKTIWPRKHEKILTNVKLQIWWIQKINLIWNRVFMQCRLLTFTLGTVLFNFISQSCVYYFSCHLHFIIELDHPSWRILHWDIYHVSQTKYQTTVYQSHISYLWRFIKHIYWYPFNFFIPVVLFDTYDLIDKNVIKNLTMAQQTKEFMY